MRVLIQRVTQASVSIGGREHSRIGAGMLLLVGIGEADSQEDIDWLAGKIARLRIFDDAEGVMNLSQAESDRAGLDCRGANRGAKNLDVVQTGGEVLAISQFTLLASTRKGNRPSYIRAARPEIAEPLYLKFAARLGRELGREIKTGVFGADMQVSLTNDGPVTIWIDSKNRE